MSRTNLLETTAGNAILRILMVPGCAGLTAGGKPGRRPSTSPHVTRGFTMKIAELLTENLVKVDLESFEKEEVFEELIDLLVREKRITDRDAARQAIIERENKQSTGIGRGVAIPHGKSVAITQLTGALGISKDGLEYDSLDGEPVHLVFLLLAEDDNPGPHVEALAQISSLFRIPGFIERLIAAGTPRELYDIIAAEESQEE